MFLALWKNALTSQIPNVISPSSVSDFRPIDPNSIHFHCMQKILLPRLMPSVNSCADAILSLVYGIFGTLLKSWSNKYLYTIFFLHFSSTFNTVLPNQLYSDLQHFIDDSWELHWLTDFLKSWTHQIKLQKGLSEKIRNWCQCPSGRSFIRFTLHNFYWWDQVKVIKYADNTAM